MENYKVPRNKKQEENNETMLMAIEKDEDKWLEIVPSWHNFRLNREATRMVKKFYTISPDSPNVNIWSHLLDPGPSLLLPPVFPFTPPFLSVYNTCIHMHMHIGFVWTIWG